MKLELELENINYCATVVRVKKLVPLEKCDNIVGMPMFGLQAIVGCDTEIGTLGVFFPAEVQLSPAFVASNNLYRHAEQNVNKDAKGYLEDNRRVRAIKLRGHRSDALFMPLHSLLPFLSSSEILSLREGDQFNKLDGQEICKKYVRRYKSGRVMLPQEKKKQRVDEKMFPQHFDSMQWLRVDRNFPDDTPIVVTQKIHGTSIRVGNVPVARKLSLLERVVKRFGVRVQETEFAMVYGSRKVVKDISNPDQVHFYESDIWTQEGKKLDGTIPQGYIVYGELVGWTTSGAPIQEHYTYNQLPGTCKLYVYRVSTVNAQGTIADLSWDALVDFCKSVGLDTVRELWRGPKRELDSQITRGAWTDTTFHPNYSTAVPLSDDSPCDEGVCIRIEGMIPSIFKLKSPLFLQHETKMLDQEVADIEADEAAGEEVEAGVEESEPQLA